MRDRRPRLLAAALAAAALAGCAPMIPRYERPAAPVPASYPGEALPVAGSPSSPEVAQAAATDWRVFFDDPRLARLIAVALEQNRDLRAAAANIEQARAIADLRRAEVWPVVGVGATATRQPGTSGRITSTYTAGLALPSWEIDVFGRIRSLREAALAQYLATAEAQRALQTSLVAQVATTYLGALADDELLAVTRRTLATREDSLRLTKLKFDVGAASEFDFRQAESLLEQARVALAQQTRQRALDDNALALLIGQALPAELPPARPLAEQRFVDLPAGLPSALLERRPDVRQAEQQLIAANANIGAARAAFFPRISLTASLGRASTELDALFSGGSLAWSFAPQILQPIFDAGRNEANLQASRAAREVAVAQYEKSVQVAFREVADALAGRATLGEQLRAQAAQAAAEARRFELADLRYRNGASSYLDVLDAQRSLFAAQQALVQARLAQLQNAVVLYRALGGGWSEPASAR